MTHVRTSPYYPQSNGKMERWYKTLKGECIRVKTPLSLDDARRIVEDFVAHYNEVRLHSAIGYVAPADKLAGRDRPIFAERDRKLDAARERRRGRPRGGSSRRRRTLVSPLPGRMERPYDEGWPGRRIGLRGDTTQRRPRGQDRRGAARCRPVFPLRDWHEGGKSTQSVPVYTLPYLPTPVSPFHAEPLHSGDAVGQRLVGGATP